MGPAEYALLENRTWEKRIRMTHVFPCYQQVVHFIFVYLHIRNGKRDCAPLKMWLFQEHWLCSRQVSEQMTAKKRRYAPERHEG